MHFTTCTGDVLHTQILSTGYWVTYSQRAGDGKWIVIGDGYAADAGGAAEAALKCCQQYDAIIATIKDSLDREFGNAQPRRAAANDISKRVESLVAIMPQLIASEGDE